MLKEQRRIYYDADLNVEILHLTGVVQKFPNHFHEYYVIGFIEGGRRSMSCKGIDYDLSEDMVTIFNPRDNHFCTPIHGIPLDYRAVHIPVEVMRDAAKEMTGEGHLPYFAQRVIVHSDVIACLRALFDAVTQNAPRLEREEALFFLLEQLIQDHADSVASTEPDPEISKLCAYMEAHFEENISLDQLVSMTRFGKSYLLRCFTKQTGVSPYRYLQSIRLNQSKIFLEKGMPPAEAAIMAGFSDQSHFTNFFKAFIGLTPKQYQRIFQVKENGDGK